MFKGEKFKVDINATVLPVVSDIDVPNEGKPDDKYFIRGFAYRRKFIMPVYVYRKAYLYHNGVVKRVVSIDFHQKQGWTIGLSDGSTALPLDLLRKEEFECNSK